MHLEGIHHVSAITASAGGCAEFYGLLLGLDRIPSRDFEGSTLAFGDADGSPGSVIAFSERPGAGAGRAGRGLVHRVLWRVEGPGALEFWLRRLELAGVPGEEVEGAAGPALRFRDPEGLEHELTVDASPEPPLLAAATGIPREHRLRGLAGVRAYARRSLESADLLAGRLGFRAAGDGWSVGGARRRAIYACDEPPPEHPVQGAGTVTHVAWSCPPGQERAWRQRVIGMGATVSRVLDADRFRCFFFREPDGVLFSVATGVAEAPATAAPYFELPAVGELPSRIARPIGLPTAI